MLCMLCRPSGRVHLVLQLFWQISVGTGSGSRGRVKPRPVTAEAGAARYNVPCSPPAPTPTTHLAHPPTYPRTHRPTCTLADPCTHPTPAHSAAVLWVGGGSGLPGQRHRRPSGQDCAAGEPGDPGWEWHLSVVGGGSWLAGVGWWLPRLRPSPCAPAASASGNSSCPLPPALLQESYLRRLSKLPAEAEEEDGLEL